MLLLGVSVSEISVEKNAIAIQTLEKHQILEFVVPVQFNDNTTSSIQKVKKYPPKIQRKKNCDKFTLKNFFTHKKKIQTNSLQKKKIFLKKTPTNSL